jgi:hypothetical protein
MLSFYFGGGSTIYQIVFVHSHNSSIVRPISFVCEGKFDVFFWQQSIFEQEVRKSAKFKAWTLSVFCFEYCSKFPMKNEINYYLNRSCNVSFTLIFIIKIERKRNKNLQKELSKVLLI